VDSFIRRMQPRQVESLVGIDSPDDFEYEGQADASALETRQNHATNHSADSLVGVDSPDDLDE
jgi:hypothetical protein